MQAIETQSISTHSGAQEPPVSPLSPCYQEEGELAHPAPTSSSACRGGERPAKASAGVEAAMRFLLDRGPKELIFAAFDIDVIRRYFPEFDDAHPSDLARLSRGAGKRG